MTSTATVTVLFTDVVGSTSMRTGRGDAAAQEVINAPNELVRQQIARHSGQEAKTIGDSFMVAFASARKAVECAVAVQRGGLAASRGVHAVLFAPASRNTT